MNHIHFFSFDNVTWNVYAISGENDRPGQDAVFQVMVADQFPQLFQGLCSENNTKANPFNCSQYMQCQNGMNKMQECPNGTNWDQETGDCVGETKLLCQQNIKGIVHVKKYFRIESQTNEQWLQQWHFYVL